MKTLEQAAKQWHGTHGIYASNGINKTIVEAFKAGAKWMAEQGYSEETYVYANRFNDENEAVIQLGQGEPERGGFKPGDKVIIQIRKAEQL